MTTRSLRRSLAAAALASSLVLGACGTPDAEESEAPAPSEITTEPSETTETSAPAEEPSEQAPSEEASVTEEPAPAPGSTREPVATGPLEGDELNPAGAAWFSAYCSGVTGALAFAGPDTEGMEKDEVIQTAATAYQNIGNTFALVSDELVALDTAANFENSEAFFVEVTDIMDEVSMRYLEGSESVSTTEFAEVSDFTDQIAEIEEGVVSAGGDGFGLPNLDDSVQMALAQLPACASA